MAFGLLIRQPAPRVPAEVRVRLGRSRRRTGPAAGQGLDCLRWQSPFQRPCPRARAGSPRFPGGPSRDSAPVHDPGRPVAPRRWRRFRYCPRPVNTEGVVGLRFRGLPRRFITCCLRFTTGVAARHARLASGWRAAPLPGGSRTRWTATRGFRSCHPPLQGLPWRNNCSFRPWLPVMRGGSAWPLWQETVRLDTRTSPAGRTAPRRDGTETAGNPSVTP